jgi:hypothetical protein
MIDKKNGVQPPGNVGDLLGVITSTAVLETRDAIRKDTALIKPKNLRKNNIVVVLCECIRWGRESQR